MFSRVKCVKLLTAIPCGLLLALVLKSGVNVESTLMISWGGFLIEDFVLFQFVFAFFPVLIQIVFFSTIISDEIDLAKTYIFPRSISRFKWYKKKIVEIIMSVFLFDMLMLFSNTVFHIFFGEKIESVTLYLTAVLILMCTYVSFNVFYILLLNILTLKFQNTYILNLGLVLFLPMQIISSIPCGFLTRINVFSQSILPLHDIKTFEMIGDQSIPGFTVLYSFFYLIILAFLLLFLGNKQLNKKDLL